MAVGVRARELDPGVVAPAAPAPVPGANWRRRLIWAAAVVAAILIGFQLTAGFPDGLVVDSAKPFNAFGDWVIEHQRTNPLFVNVLVPLKNGINNLFTQLVTIMDRLTWLGVTTLAASIAGLLAGWRRAVLAAAGFLLMGVLGLWAESLETLALIIFAVTVALAIGIPLGILAGRHPALERALRPVLDAMQTVPAFSYLVPLVLLFSIGTTTALIATVIFALPPAIRLTSLGIQMVPASSLEVGHAFGADSRQVLRKIQLPMAKPSIMLGVNQTIMMALGMVVIAASVGFKGLGREVYNALQTRNNGQALAAGIAIVALAIVLDRVTHTWSIRDRLRRGDAGVSVFGRHMARRTAALICLGLVVIAVVLTRQVLLQQDFPQGLTLSIAGPVNDGVSWLTRTIGGATGTLSDWMVIYALEPLRKLLTGIPWWMVCAGAALIAWQVSKRIGLAVVAFVCLMAIGVLGMWDIAMDTLSQVVVGVISSVVIAIPIGVWSARSDRVQRMLRPILDTMQTMPQFVYLVPVVALFHVGRVPGVIAALVYALPPGIRLTDSGIRQVPKETVEAAQAFGATPRQLLWKVQLPLARRSILLGVNQTVIMVLSVVIIAGLVGGGGLGYEVIKGLSHDPGRGMVAGLCILLLAIVIDRITQAMGQGTGGRASPAGRSRFGLMSPRRRATLVSPDMSVVTTGTTQTERKGEG
ncbi:MAG: ABC transporter permease subunit [Actinomycetota bacterium]